MGKKLLSEISEKTGLPQQWVMDELKAMIKQSGYDPDKLSLEDLRLVLAEHLQDILLKAKEQTS